MQNSEKKFSFFSIIFSLFFLFLLIWQAKSFSGPSFYLSKSYPSDYQTGNIKLGSSRIIKTLAERALDISKLDIGSQGKKSKVKADKEEGNQLSLSSSAPFNWPRKNYSFPLPKVSFESGLIMGLKDGYVFFQKEPNKILPIASLTKLMTSIIAFDKISPEAKIKISEKAVLTGGSSFARLREGEIFKRNDLIQLMLMASNNQAAFALAQSLSSTGSVKKFVESMNKKARKLHLKSTYFLEPTGLSPKNESSALDLFKLAKYVFLKYPEIFYLQKKPERDICSEEYGETICHHLVNIDLFVKRNDFLGGKTGYTDQAGGCLISIFRWKEPVVMIVLNSKDRFGDTEKMFTWLKESY